jgi:hypothetical protein
METPRINPVGIAEYPPGFSASPRPAPRWLRILAALLLLLFGFSVVSTTVFSVGRYCLTSDGGDTRNLPEAARRVSPAPGR